MIRPAPLAPGLLVAAAIALGAAIGPGLAFGQSGAERQAAQGRPQRHGPPAEAIDACRQRKADEACRFEGRRGTLSGRCWAPEGRPLACRPENAPAHEPRGQR
ncbi:MAG: hypothetical protein H6934_12465 [Burkholderiaceae bacterium]|nr:hypothetical protein [Burkholderiaceae bacterium]